MSMRVGEEFPAEPLLGRARGDSTTVGGDAMTPEQLAHASPLLEQQPAGDGEAR